MIDASDDRAGDESRERPGAAPSAPGVDTVTPEGSVRQPASCDVSDATLGLVLGMVLLVPGTALLLAHSIWGLPEWLAPVAGALVAFGLVFLMASLKQDGL